MAEAACLFSDAGCIGRNPSTLAGTWCWCQISSDGLLGRHDCGIVEPQDIGLPAVTNNLTELLAAVRGLAAMPVDWNGVLYTDSRVTQCRLERGLPCSFPGVPDWLRQQLVQLRTARHWRVQLLAGHPTRQETVNGYRLRNGLPVSKWNQFCDSQCRALAQAFLDKRKVTSYPCN